MHHYLISTTILCIIDKAIKIKCLVYCATLIRTNCDKKMLVIYFWVIFLDNKNDSYSELIQRYYRTTQTVQKHQRSTKASNALPMENLVEILQQCVFPKRAVSIAFGTEKGRTVQVFKTWQTLPLVTKRSREGSKPLLEWSLYQQKALASCFQTSRTRKINLQLTSLTYKELRVAEGLHL